MDDETDTYKQFQSTLPVRGETYVTRAEYAALEFQSTLPLRGETAIRFTAFNPQPISIHSPRVRRDSKTSSITLLYLTYFAQKSSVRLSLVHERRQKMH